MTATQSGTASTRYAREVIDGKRYVFLHGNEAETAYWRLARRLHDSGQLVDGSGAPTIALVGISRGGTPIKTYVSHALEAYGLRHNPIAISASSYEGTDQTEVISVHGVEDLIGTISSHGYRSAVIFDDVFDTGRTMDALRKIMRNGLRKQDAFGNPFNAYEFHMESGTERYDLRIPLSADIRPLHGDVTVLVAVLHWKRNANITDFGPDIFVDDTFDKSDWIVYPWGAPPDLMRQEKDEKVRKELRRAFRRHYPKAYSILFGHAPT